MDAMERYIFPTYIWRKTKTQHNQKSPVLALGKKKLK